MRILLVLSILLTATSQAQAESAWKTFEKMCLETRVFHFGGPEAEKNCGCVTSMTMRNIHPDYKAALEQGDRSYKGPLLNKGPDDPDFLLYFAAQTCPQTIEPMRAHMLKKCTDDGRFTAVQCQEAAQSIGKEN